MKTMIHMFMAFLLAALVTVACSGQALVVGDVRQYQAESPHPYGKAVADKPVWTDKVVSPEATFLRVEFADFELAPGDFVLVLSPDRSVSWKYTGKGPHNNGRLWSFVIPGDTAVVELHAPSGGAYGYRIVGVGHGTVDLYPHSNKPLPAHVQGSLSKAINGWIGRCPSRLRFPNNESITELESEAKTAASAGFGNGSSVNDSIL